MKNKRQNLAFPLIVMCVSVMLLNGCKKEKKDPLLTWTNPSDISYGTLLSATQLNASSGVQGTFVYTPASGTKLNVGINQVLKVDFTPSDAGSTKSASKTVTINVTEAVITFNSNLVYGSLTDLDGNVYKTITIGTQTWMAENLRTTKYRNGDAIPNITDNKSWAALTTGAYCNYNNTNNIDTIAIFGRLYNWSAATDNRIIAPLGWHVPSDSEWGLLKAYLGNQIPNHKLKEASLAHWSFVNADDNTSGFTAFPCGFRYADTGLFTYYPNVIYWLSSTKFNNTSSFITWVYNGSDLLGSGASASAAGWSVRCIKD